MWRIKRALPSLTLRSVREDIRLAKCQHNQLLLWLSSTQENYQVLWGCKTRNLELTLVEKGQPGIASWRTYCVSWVMKDKQDLDSKAKRKWRGCWSSGIMCAKALRWKGHGRLKELKDQNGMNIENERKSRGKPGGTGESWCRTYEFWSWAKEPQETTERFAQGHDMIRLAFLKVGC